MASRESEDAAAHDGTPTQVPVGEVPTAPRGLIEICEYDPTWPRQYEREAARIRAALGDRVIRLEHAGSTSVPGLAAKPIIDIVLSVADSAREAAYAPDLVAAGYVLRIREPEWLEHRMFRGTAPMVNLHVFSADCHEIERMLAFRDWLRVDATDRQRYVDVKRALAARDWEHVQQYADAKTDVVADIMSRALPDR